MATQGETLHLGMHIPAGQCQELIEKAKRIYVTGYNIQEIARVLGLNRKTIGNWRNAYAFDEAKDKAPLSLDEIVARLQRDFQDKIDGGTLSADEAIKYAAAIEKISSRSRLNFYLIDAVERIQKALEARIQAAKRKEKSA